MKQKNKCVYRKLLGGCLKCGKPTDIGWTLCKSCFDDWYDFLKRKERYLSKQSIKEMLEQQEEIWKLFLYGDYDSERSK